MMLHKVLGVSLVAGMLAACGGPLEYQSISSPRAPGADASITADVKKDQRQTELVVNVENLPPAERLDGESQHYVAWYRRNSQDTWQRIAALDYEEDSREGFLQSAVPETSFDLWVTAERDLDVASPSANVVFEQRIGS